LQDQKYQQEMTDNPKMDNIEYLGHMSSLENSGYSNNGTQPYLPLKYLFWVSLKRLE
jgi:hypothetical protein